MVNLIVTLCIVGAISLISIVIVLRTVLKMQDESNRGWAMATQAYQDVAKKQFIRINTLENRLMARTWEEFAHLQNVPDEMTKEAYINSVENEGYGQSFDDRVAYEGIMEGVDLEGPTLG